MDDTNPPEGAPDYTLSLTEPHPCNIIPGRTQREQIMTRNAPLSPEFNSVAYAQGYLRTASTYRRDHCDACQACKPARWLLDEFNYSASQRHIMNKNRDITYSVTKNYVMDEHINLFRRYFNERHARHSDIGTTVMMNERRNIATLISLYGMIEFRDSSKKLVGGVLFDWASDALIASHTYYDPQLSKERSLGTYMLLVMAEHAKRFDMKYLYLGSLTTEPSSLAYKSRFRPLEVMERDGTWARLRQP
jgi:arginine-tRNA-protein transferase